MIVVGSPCWSQRTFPLSWALSVIVSVLLYSQCCFLTHLFVAGWSPLVGQQWYRGRLSHATNHHHLSKLPRLLSPPRRDKSIQQSAAAAAAAQAGNDDDSSALERTIHTTSKLSANGSVDPKMTNKNHTSTTTAAATATAGINSKIKQLQDENKRLRETLRRVELENERLHQQFDNRIILETFEGEAKLKEFQQRQQQQQQQQKQQQQKPLSSLTLMGEEMLNEDESESDFDSTSSSYQLENDVEQQDTQQQQQLLLQQQDEECLLELIQDNEDDPEIQQLLARGACPIEPSVSFGEALRDRAYWLVGLLILQSCSGIILARNEALLTNHPVIVYFLTMLVGAGGNAGNQASVRVIRGLALGTLNAATQGQFLIRELKMAVSLSSILSLAGFLRAAVFRTPFVETIAVTAALALIVFSSICLGAVLPLLLKQIGVDPAHSSTTIQVVMDILGVLLAVLVSTVLLDSPLGAMLVQRLSFIG